MEENIGSEIVSMRCLRHKKRFNVPKGWLETSKWLCPHCFENLSEEERRQFSLKKHSMPKTREAEKGKPVKYPSFWMEGGNVVEENANSEEGSKDGAAIGIGDVTLVTTGCKMGDGEQISAERAATMKEGETDTVSQEDEKPVPREKKKGTRNIHAPEGYKAGSYAPESKLANNPRLAGLLPRFTVFCQKCGQTVKCHYSWFNQSTVLCPECFSQMGYYEREQFHKKHFGVKPEYSKPETPMPIYEQPLNYDRNEDMESDVKHRGYQLVSGEWTPEDIRYTPMSRLLAGVKRGYISAARLRAELRRRQAPEYYEACHTADNVFSQPKFA